MNALIKKCDKLWSQLVILSAGGKCEKFGSNKHIQAHHIVPRTNWNLRFDERNGIALCRKCHLYWAHKDSIEFYNWLANYRNSDLTYLEFRRYCYMKNDYRAIEAYLKNEIKKFGQQLTPKT